MTDDELLDCLVIGGGAAGLTAAVYLGRYKRRAVVLDDGGSRLQRIPRTRNVPGFPDGIEGPELLRRMREHAAKYTVPTVSTRIESLQRLEDGTFRADSPQGTWRSRFVLLATGARDVEPEIDGMAAALEAGHVRYCPICDGFETQHQRVSTPSQMGQ
jgi:thioredoxin reductase (NADPH)